MKFSLLFSLLFVMILTGCTSMQPMDDQTRQFLDEQPGMRSGYETDVKTTTGEHIRLKENTASFDTANGQNILTGTDKRNDGGKRSIPVSNIYSFSLARDMAIITRDSNRFEAENGKWEIVPCKSATWSWHATPPIIANNLKTNSADSTVYTDVTIPNSEIASIYIAKINAFRTIVLIVGTALAAVLVFIGLIFLLALGQTVTY